MAINIPVPFSINGDVAPLLREILRRAVDGTVVPLFVSATNNVGVGTSTPLYSFDINGTLNVVGTAMFTSGTFLDMLNCKNIDVPGQGTFNFLGVTGKADINNLNAYGDAYFNGDIVMTDKENGRPYRISVRGGVLDCAPL